MRLRTTDYYILRHLRERGWSYGIDIGTSLGISRVNIYNYLARLIEFQLIEYRQTPSRCGSIPRTQYSLTFSGAFELAVHEADNARLR